jgi:hypothetical protein
VVDETESAARRRPEPHWKSALRHKCNPIKYTRFFPFFGNSGEIPLHILTQLSFPRLFPPPPNCCETTKRTRLTLFQNISDQATLSCLQGMCRRSMQNLKNECVRSQIYNMTGLISLGCCFPESSPQIDARCSPSPAALVPRGSKRPMTTVQRRR